jgi:hypothetical protein
MTTGGVRGLAAARLRVLNALPRRHQDHFFEVVRTLCTRYIALASRHDPKLDRESEGLELFSEVIAKLLGVTGAGGEQNDEGAGDNHPAWTISDDPKRDERVAWLIDQIGGPHALKHRYEDIRRRRHGGKWREGSYRQVQLEAEHIEHLGVDADDPHHDDDVRQIWRGVMAMAASEFDAKADVLVLLTLMAQDPDIQAGFGAAWPIAQMVDVLNRRYPDTRWNDDRVENAKKRLKNWIGRLQRAHGLDANDLMDLFARHGRARKQYEVALSAPPPSVPAVDATARSEVGR